MEKTGSNIRRNIVAAVAMLAILLIVLALVGCGGSSMYYIVKFDSNGGTVIEDQRVNKDACVKNPTDPKRIGYTFDSWYSGDADIEWNFSSDKVNSNLTLKAQWWLGGPDDKSVTYNITFDSRGGSNVEKVTANKGAYAVEPEEPERDGYTFGGWYKDTQLTDRWVFEAYPMLDNVKLYAKWDSLDLDDVKHTVTFFTLTDTVSVTPQSVKHGYMASEPASPALRGYQFAGWYKDRAGTEPWVFNGDAVNANTVLYAKWDKHKPEVAPQKYTVTFDSRGGSAVDAQTVTEGGLISRPPEPTRSGYTFDGWYKERTYKNAWNFATDTVTAETTLYAAWTKVSSGEDPGDEPAPGDDEPEIPANTVVATFNVGLDARRDGVSNPPPVRVAKGGKITAPTVKRTGYKLKGWYVDNGTVVWNFASGVFTTNTTLFAKWEPDTSNAMNYTPTMRNDNTLYIHYLRSSGDYTDWSLWVWATGGNGKEYKLSTTDISGAVYAIDLTEYGNVNDINFIAAKIRDNWTKDGGDNNVKLSDTLTVGGSYHWFIQEGRTATGSKKALKLISSKPKTESKRASESNVDRSAAAALPVADTVTGWDDVGVGYQIFVASFCDSNGDGTGDIRGIINKLEYLDKTMNVDVLWLTPVQPSDSIHGYDCYDYYSIDPKFGTNADYRELVYKAHQRGMKVIMDLVVNHTSRSNEWFEKSKNCVIETVTYPDGTSAEVRYRDFYRWRNTQAQGYHSAGDGWYYYSSFNEYMPELNYDYQPVRDMMTAVATYWMEYGLDGFRMDAIKHVYMWNESANAPGDVEAAHYDTGYNFNMTKNIEWFKEFNYRLKRRYRNCFLLGEQLSGDIDCVAPFYAGMDSLFDFNTYRTMPGRITSHEAASQAETFNFNAAAYAENRQKGRAINSMISSNHDMSRLYDVIGNTERIKLYFSVMMSMPGISWIYYGDEIGLRNSGTGDNSYRQSMKWTDGWDNECTVVGSRGTNINTRSVADQQVDSGSILRHVQTLTSLRNTHPALVTGTARCVEENGMLKITVTGSGETIVAYHNFSGEPKTVNISGTVLAGAREMGNYGSLILKTA